jgi:hypothetical protein
MSRLKKRVAELEEEIKDLKRSTGFTKLQNLELDIAKIQTQMLSLRGLFNRSRAKIDSTDESGMDSEEGKSNKVLLPEK